MNTLKKARLRLRSDFAVQWFVKHFKRRLKITNDIFFSKPTSYSELVTSNDRSLRCGHELDGLIYLVTTTCDSIWIQDVHLAFSKSRF